MKKKKCCRVKSQKKNYKGEKKYSQQQQHNVEKKRVYNCKLYYTCGERDV